jgi:hypothetical protein
MRRLYSVGLLLFLALVSLPSLAHAQEKGGGSARERGFRLEQNYPNPFNPETRIPYRLDGALFEGGRPVVVSIRIFNVLQQLVAIPVALNYPAGGAPPVNRLEYPSPGDYVAYWDGYDRNGRKVASGIYYMQLVVNGESTVRKMVVGK